MSPNARTHPAEPRQDLGVLDSIRRVHSDDLLQGDRRVVIEHRGARYTLLLTRNDKLILVK